VARHSRRVPPGSPPDNAQVRCAICDRPIADARLTDAQTGRVFHPSCVVGRLPEDAVIRMLGVLALVALPAVLVWAG
jgi:hypothetical protein